MGQKVVTFFHVGDIKPYVKWMVDSVLIWIDAPIVQMTDMDTKRVKNVDDCIRIPSHGIAKARINHLRKCPFKEFLHLDTDVIVKGDVMGVFDSDFDVALTTSPDRHERSKFNSGVMFSRCPDFWEACYRWFDDQGPKTADWGGDQRSVNAVAKDFNVLELPCFVYNWSPSEDNQTSDALIYHYKGNRKKWNKGT